MGGRGSGSWYRWDKKTCIEETKRIDIRHLKKKDWLAIRLRYWNAQLVMW